MKKLLTLIIGVATCFAMSAETWTIQGSSYTMTETSTKQLGTSTTFKTAKLESSSDALRIFYSITDLTNSNVEIRAVQGGSKLATRTTVSAMGNAINDETATTGITAIAGVNADFFTTSSPIAPIGSLIKDGMAHKCFTGDGFSAIAVDQNNVPYIGKLTKHNCWLYNQTTAAEGWSDYAAINTTSANATDCGVGEQIIFYTPQYGSTSSGNESAGGYAVQLKPVNNALLTPGKYLTYEVVSSPSSGSVTIPSDGIVLFGKGSGNGTFVSGLSVGDKVTVYTRIELTEYDGTVGLYSENGTYINQAVGGSMMILCNGVTASSYTATNGDIAYDAPRTAVGYNADKTKLVMCVVDGRNSGYTNGCTGKEMADIMKALGCSDALNFDGGGSSQFWNMTDGLANDAKTNNDGSTVRSVCDALFIVEKEATTPVLTTSVSSLSFSTTNNTTTTQSVTVSGTDLEGNITLALSGTNADQFSISASSIAQATASGTITVTYAPTSTGSHSATLTVSSTNATSKTIALSGSNSSTTTLTSSDSSVALYAVDNSTSEKSITVTGTDLTSDIALSLSGANADQFSISVSSIAQATASGTVTVTYNPSEIASHTATLVISTPNASAVEVALTGVNKSSSVINTASEGYKFTQSWAKTGGHLKAETNSRWATAHDGKIYVNDHTNSKLYYWSENGLTDMGISSTAGCAIASDDEGNIILAASQWSTTSFKILPAGSSTFQTVAITMPEGVSSAAMIYMGDAIGDVMSATGGAIYLFPNGATSVAKIIIANGEQVSATAIEVSTVTADARTIALPLTNDISSDDIVVRDRDLHHFYYNNGSEFVAYSNNGISTTQGGTVFTLGGATYTVEPIGKSYCDGFQIVNTDDNQIVATHTLIWETAANSPNANVIIAEPYSSSEVKLYQYVPGQLAAMYSFSTDKETGIENIEEADAPAEYYNLQGIKVVNPSKGIYIKKQGAKTTKVIL